MGQDGGVGRGAPGIGLFSQADVEAGLPLPECIDAVEAAFRAHALGHCPAPGILGMHLEGGGFHIKAASLDGLFATKVNGNFAHSTPRIQGLVILCDAARGTPLAVMDSVAITTIRTAAATGVAARWLARPDARTLTIAGCGVQAPWQVAAVKAVRSIERVFAYDIDPRRAASLPGAIVAESLAEAAGQSDIVITCTPSTRPILHDGDVRPGTFIAAVGADAEHKHEIGPALMARAVVIPDILEQAATIGDLHHAIDAGVMTHADIRAALGDVVAGRKPGRNHPDEIVVFDSTGTALQDVAAAAIVYRRLRGRDRFSGFTTRGFR